jgi:amidohydrolase
MGTSDWRKVLDSAIDARFSEIVAVRRHLHANPEPSGEERETSKFIAAQLTDLGLKPRLGPDGRGVLADGGKASGPRVALRADIDCLRIHEQNQVPFCSQRPGLMHACGHDAHTATVFGAVLGLQALEAAGVLPAPVAWRAIYQPAEETGQGAIEMVAAGAVEGVSAAFAAHVDPTRAVGRIGVRWGVFTASCDDIDVKIVGKGGHAARPHETLDPVAAAAMWLNAFFIQVPRGADSQESVVASVGHIVAGANRNVIPSHVELHGTLRTLDRVVREQTIARIHQLSRGIAETTGTQITVETGGTVLSVQNNPECSDLLWQCGTEVLGEANLDKIPRPSMGAEDFSGYLEHVPGAMFRLGCSSPEVGSSALHTPTMGVDEKALAIGAKILARAAILAQSRGE